MSRVENVLVIEMLERKGRQIVDDRLVSVVLGGSVCASEVRVGCLAIYLFDRCLVKVKRCAVAWKKGRRDR